MFITSSAKTHNFRAIDCCLTPTRQFNPNPNRNPILGHNFIGPDTISYRNLYKILSEGGHFKIGHYYVLHKHYENPTKYKADHIIISLKTNMLKQ
jgi:hypothetical protein